MNVDQLAESLRRDQSFMENVVRWEELPAREARYGDFPPELDARLLPVLLRPCTPCLCRLFLLRQVLRGLWFRLPKEGRP